MKRFFSVILSVILILSLIAGCGGGGSEQAGGSNTDGVFAVGYGKADISPEHPVYLRGYGSLYEERTSTGVAERLYATVVAIQDATGNKVLLISLDLLGCDTGVMRPIRKQIAEAVGLPYDNVMVSCSHSHTGPDMGDFAYRELLAERMLQASQEALANVKPATMEITFCRPEGMNFNRHYLLIDGTYQGEAVGKVPRDQVYGHYAKADNLLQMVRFNREGDKPVMLVNWQGHPMGPEPNTITTATSNVAGMLRETVEAGLDCYTSYFLGGSGNANNSSQIDAEERCKTYIEAGKTLGEEIIKVVDTFEQVETGDIQIEIGYLNTSGVEDTAGAPYYAMSFGDVAFAFAPNEIFDTNAMAVKENSKFQMTFYASCSNESYGYLPTDPSFDWVQHYEVRITKYPKGTALVVQNMLSGLLDKCFEASGNVEAPKREGYVRGEFVPTSNGVVYTNPAAGDTTAYTKVENGFCQFVMLEGTTVKRFLALNEEVVKEVLMETTAKLLVNEQNVVVGVEK